MSLAEALSVRGLRIELAAGLPVVEDISFAVGQGETLALVGESGSGKTTTALALLGYARSGLRIAAGEIEIAGQTVPLGDEGAARALRGKLVSHVPQEPGASLNPSLRIGDCAARRPARAPARRAARGGRRAGAAPGEPAGDARSSCSATRTSSRAGSSSGS